jgi:hypothetical protein
VHEESGRQLTSAVLSRKIAGSFFPPASSADFKLSRFFRGHHHAD